MKLSAASSRINRRPQGAAIVVLMFVLAFFVIGVLGVFAFDVTTNNSCRDQLRTACEAAALAGAAALASSNSTDPSTSHTNACQAAEWTFVSNSVLGNLLSNETLLTSQTSSASAALGSNPGVNAVVFYVEFLNSNGTVAQWSDPSGQIIHVIAVYGEMPPFAQYVGLGKVNVSSQARAQVPPMDIVMCFDVSSSIDDQSLVTFVKRFWNGSAIQYNIASTASGAPANGTIYQVLTPFPIGSAVNLERPQALEQASTSNSQTRMNFDVALREGPGGTDSNEPPGNYPGSSSSSNPTDFTDMVANLDGNPVFSPPYTYVDASGNSWSFPSLGTVVEAERGNLENATVFANSKANTGLPASVTPKSGYQNAYYQAAHNLTKPIGPARQAAIRFWTIMNNNANVWASFVAFGSGVSISPTGTDSTTYAIADGYAPGGMVTPTFPGEPLGANNVNTIINSVVPLTIADGGTDMGNALQEAVNELINNGRTGANKTIIFFTDGQPNGGISWQPSAQLAQQHGIAIYTVGMAQNSGIIPGECNNLNDQAGKTITYTDPITGVPGSYTPSTPGMAAVAQNGGKFFLVTDYNDLNYVFENIARQLVRL